MLVQLMRWEFGATGWQSETVALYDDGNLYCTCAPSGKCVHKNLVRDWKSPISYADYVNTNATIGALYRGYLAAFPTSLTPERVLAKVVQRIYALENPNQGAGRLFDFGD